MLENLSSQQLAKAAALKERIETLEAELAQIIGASQSEPARLSTSSGRRSMSAAAKARIGAATKARWARFRAAKGKSAPPAKKQRRRMTPAARARLAASAKARWAKAKASGKNAL